MQVEQVKQQFSQVEQSIKQATQALQNDKSAPPELKDSLRELGTQSAKIQQALDEDGIRTSFDELERIGMRAKKAAETGNVSPQTKTAVMRACEGIAQAKQRLN